MTLDEFILPDVLNFFVNCICQVLIRQFITWLLSELAQFILDSFLSILSFLELIVETFLNVAYVCAENGKWFVLHLEFEIVPAEALEQLLNRHRFIASLGTEIDVQFHVRAELGTQLKEQILILLATRVKQFFVFWKCVHKLHKLVKRSDLEFSFFYLQGKKW